MRYSGISPPYSALVLLDPDIAEVFPDSKAVNEALGLLLRGSDGNIPSARSRKGEAGN